MEINFDETFKFVDEQIEQAIKKREAKKMKNVDTAVDLLIEMKLEDDEVTACLDLIEKMREEKRLAAKRTEVENRLTGAVFDMVEVTSVAYTKHLMRELMRAISPLE